jgi:hypothetical protein
LPSQLVPRLRHSTPYPLEWRYGGTSLKFIKIVIKVRLYGTPSTPSFEKGEFNVLSISGYSISLMRRNASPYAAMVDTPDGEACLV